MEFSKQGMGKVLGTFWKTIGIELLVIFILIFSINNYLKKPDSRIGNADGMGYYDYLPSIFIRNDFKRNLASPKNNPELYENIINKEGVYVEYEDKYVNKYPSGTALLQLPFFLFEFSKHTNENGDLTGYEGSFHTSVFHAAVFYLFLALFFLKLFLTDLKVKIWIIFFIQLLIALGTNVTFYTNYDASFSHVYSLFAINAFLFVVYRYFNLKEIKYFIWACVLLGLILNLRQVNLLVILIIPFLAGSWENLKSGVLFIFTRTRYLFLGIGMLLAIVFIQFFLWYMQTGHWIIYSYQNESFNFLEPHFIDILFSYKKGLFLYTPVLFIAMISSVWLFFQKKYYLFGTWIVFFVLITYVLSSWWSWFYGCSFGHRAYIEFFGILMIPFALFLNHIRTWFSISIVVICLVSIPVNLIQSFQYNKYILHWIDMNEEMYWKVFLKTENKYQGLVWVEQVDFATLTPTDSVSLGSVRFKSDMNQFEFNISTDSIKDFTEVNRIIVSIENEFNEELNIRVRLHISEESNVHSYYHDPPIIHFARREFGIDQTGYYSYNFPKMTGIENGNINLNLFNNNSNTEVKNIKLVFYK